MAAEDLLSQLRAQFGYNQELIAQAQAATRGEAAARAGAYQQNASLLRFDAEQYRAVGKEAFGTEYRKGIQRTADVASEYVGSGVQLSGSARAVTSDVYRESMREATAVGQQYEYQARRAQKQADIQDYYSTLELQAGEYEAQSIQSKAQASFEAAKQRYLGENLGKYLEAISVNPMSFKAGEAKMAIDRYTAVAGLTLAGNQSIRQREKTIQANMPSLPSSYGYSSYY